MRLLRLKKKTGMSFFRAAFLLKVCLHGLIKFESDALSFNPPQI